MGAKICNFCHPKARLERRRHCRARRIQRFLSQNTYVAKQFTGIEGSTVPVADTIEAFNKIAAGEYDHVAEQAFFMCGGLDDVEQKWAEIQKNL